MKTTTTTQNITEKKGWGESEQTHVDGNNATVETCVHYTDGTPDRVSVITDDGGASEIGPNAVRQILRALGYSAPRLVWEAGEREGEGVAFFSVVQS